MRLIRWILGRVILVIEFIMKPKGVRRGAEEQKQLDEATKHLSLYQLSTCPFCVWVRYTLKKLNINIRIRDVKRDATARAELIGCGGKFQVPCLKIEHGKGNVEWLYESKDIKRYLENNFTTVQVVEEKAVN